MVGGFLLGIGLPFVWLYWWIKSKIRPQIADKTFASARYSKRHKKWIVTGDLKAVYEAIEYDRVHRPGSVKYVD